MANTRYRFLRAFHDISERYIPDDLFRRITDESHKCVPESPKRARKKHALPLIAEMYRSGEQLSVIMSMMQCSRGAIYSAIRHSGIPRRIPHFMAFPQRPWSAEELAKLRTMRAYGLSISTIGRRLGRTNKSVQAKIYGSNEYPLGKVRRGTSNSSHSEPATHQSRE